MRQFNGLSQFKNLRVGHHIRLLALVGFVVVGGAYMAGSSQLDTILKKDRPAVETATVAEGIT